MGVFRNRYDAALQSSSLDLPEDDAHGMRDRTAAAFLSVIQVPLPVSITAPYF